MERSGGVAAIACDATRKHGATGELLHMSRDRGYFSRATKHKQTLRTINLRNGYEIARFSNSCLSPFHSRLME